MEIIKNADYSKVVLDNLKKINHPFVNGIIVYSFKSMDYYIWGGFIRDSLAEYFHGIKLKPNDIDYLVDYKNSEHSGLPFGNLFLDFDWQMKKSEYIYRIWFCGEPFDFGSLEFNKRKLSDSNAPTGLEQNLSNCDLDVCAIAYSPKRDEFYDCGAINAIKKKEINILSSIDYDVNSTLYRIIAQSDKLGFTMGESAINYIKKKYTKDTDKLVRKYMQYKGKDDLIDHVIEKLQIIHG